MTYMVDGKQYVSIASMSTPRQAMLVTLALPGPQ